MTDDTGAVTDSYRYDGYGKVTYASGSTFLPFRYGGRVGYYHDGESEMLLATHRWYSAKLGRWMSRDPIGYQAGDNLYGYVRMSPLRYVDPLGLQERTLVGECFCPFMGSAAVVQIDCSCAGQPISITPEADFPSPSINPAECGKYYFADGVKIGGQDLKIDGSTCVTIHCDGAGGGAASSCINHCGFLFNDSSAPYPVSPSTFGGPPKQLPASHIPKPVSPPGTPRFDLPGDIKILRWIGRMVFFSNCRYTFAIVVMFIFATSALIAWATFWGKGQSLPLFHIERQLRVGISPEESCHALDRPRHCCELVRIDNAHSYCTISSVGLGSLFAPQHSVKLLFDGNLHLVKAVAESKYRIEEQTIALRLSASL